VSSSLSSSAHSAFSSHRSASSSSLSANTSVFGASCQSTGAQTVTDTIVVKTGQIFDGECKTFNPTFGGGSQQEGQPPVFRLESGAVLKNVIIGVNGADGIHTYGDVTLDNITWSDVGEDALTVKSEGNVLVRNITGASADDKFFQLNAKTTLTVDNCNINGAGKIVRENGNRCYPVVVNFNRCTLANVKEAIFRSDCNQSRFAITQSKFTNVAAVCYAGGQYLACGADY
jgi:pectate lyase C